MTGLPAVNGTRPRIVDIPRDSDGFLRHGAARMPVAFHQIGDAASTMAEESPHPLMHRMESVDCAEVVVQRGTNQAGANRSGQMCRMLFVLVDGVFDPALAAA